jgi:DNA-binding MarR family transcriptional regulator
MIDQDQRDLYGFFRKAGRFLYDYTGGKSGQRRVLMFLHHGVLSQRDVQNKLQIKASSLSEMLSKMEKEGLLVRKRSQEDSRQILITLTKKGEKYSEEGMKLLDDMTEKLYDCLSDEERSELHRLMKKLLMHWDTLKDDEEFKLLVERSQGND